MWGVSVYIIMTSVVFWMCCDVLCSAVLFCAVLRYGGHLDLMMTKLTLPLTHL